MTDLVQRAKDLAHRAHAGQVDKAGRPYIEHVARVAAAVSDDPEAEAVAWLHDVLEDAPEFDAEVFATFPGEVYGCVDCLTRSGYINARGNYYSVIRRHPIALRVKLADIADKANEDRLAVLDGKTAARLRAKYARALRALGGECDR